MCEAMRERARCARGDHAAAGRARPGRGRRGLAAAAAALALGVLGAAPATGADGDQRAADGACGQDRRPGTTTVTVVSQGARHPVLVHLPPLRDRRRPPLVLNLHGSALNGAQQQANSEFARVADEHGFVVAAPDGAIPLGADGHAWNVPGVPIRGDRPVPPGSRDDIRFLLDVVRTLTERGCADPDRVYAAGYSGGARMASALACHAPERLAAIAAVGGLRAGNPDPADPSRPDPRTCAPRRPVPVIAFHGLLDELNPYDGGGAAHWRYPVPEAARTWARLDGCAAAPARRAVTAHLRLARWTACRDGAAVDLYTVTDGGHTWPGSSHPVPARFGATTREIHASEAAWRFFERFHR
ncbi:hypothetical protein GCM10027168_25080 [Streptomyces capparidis]